jgi:hypothetical protein
MAGVTNTCMHCKATLYDEETSYSKCVYCKKEDWDRVKVKRKRAALKQDKPSSVIVSEDASLPEREVMTPLGKAKFRNKTLEEKGYRWTFVKDTNNELLEIVYLKDDGSTGTLIADLDTLFDRKIVSKDNLPYCIVTLKIIAGVGSTVELVRADVPIKSLDDVTHTLKKPGVLNYFFEKIYGRKV